MRSHTKRLSCISLSSKHDNIVTGYRIWGSPWLVETSEAMSLEQPHQETIRERMCSDNAAPGKGALVAALYQLSLGGASYLYAGERRETAYVICYRRIVYHTYSAQYS